MSYEQRITLKLGIAYAGLGTGITAHYFNSATPPVEVGTKVDGIQAELGNGEYSFYDSAVPTTAITARFHKASDDTFLTSTSVEAPAAGGGGGSVSVTVVPLVTTVGDPALSTTSGTNLPLQIFQNEAVTWSFAVLNPNGTPYDLAGKSLSFVVYKVHPSTGVVTNEFTRTTAAGDITTSGTPTENVANVTTTSANHADADRYDYRLWDLDANRVAAYGRYKVDHAPQA